MIDGISVVIPLYNKEQYIYKCIESVLSQTYTKFEIIIIDDGSNDNSLSIVNAFNNKFIKIISQKNMGVSIARNNGVKNAKYNFIAFIDADDEWLPNHLDELNKLVIFYPEAKLWASGYKKSNENKISQNLYKIYDLNDYLINRLNGVSIAWTSAVLVSKESFLSKNGFMANHNHGEDQALWLDLASSGSIAKSFNITAKYNIYPNSLSSKLLITDDFCMLTVDKLIKNSVNLTNETKNLLYEFKCHYALSHAINALLNKERRIFKFFFDKCKNTKKFKMKKNILKIFYYISFISLNLSQSIFSKLLNKRIK